MAQQAWARALLAAATTLASTSHAPPHLPSAEGSCSLTRGALEGACAASDAHVAPLHVLAPLALPCAVHVFAHMPTLLLASKHRVRRLWGAVAHLAAIWAALLAVAGLFLRGAPSLAYALSLHASALFLAGRPHAGLLIAPAAHAAARYAALGALVALAAYAGPPLPVLDAPGAPGCCGAAAHLASWAAAETALAAAVWLLDALFGVE